MAKLKNPIGWCDATGNLLIGCRGCELGARCYARNNTPARVLRAGMWPGTKGRKIETFGPGSERVITKNGLGDLAALNKICICPCCHETAPIAALGIEHGRLADGYCGVEFRRIRYFADSDGDWMDWPVEILARTLDKIRLAPNVIVILCTKWPELWPERMRAALAWLDSLPVDDQSASLANLISDWLYGRAPTNMWLLTSVTTGKTLRRADDLLKIPAAVHGLSMEPLWENIIIPHEIITRMNWIITGGESGKGRRDCGVDALVSVAIQALATGLPVYVKQDSTFKPGQQGRIPDNVWKLKHFPIK